ncbi:MmpS family transport accessory protein [Actinoplanes sp. NPDC049596]|uniref:MmpS family transport accessory protein n=1 Tax=unclassified Actinoplanes TaxID=2626549 RepID=UPI00343F3970
MSSNPEPPGPRPPTFQPGSAKLPDPDYPPTSEFPATPSDQVPPGYPSPGYGTPYDPYGPPPQAYPPPSGPPKKSSVPIVAVIVAVTLLLCGGVATAGVLIARNVTQKAEEAVKPITEPDLPALPTDVPGISDQISVTYEVTGDGPASQLLYVETLGESPTRLENVTLPWKFTGDMDTPALLSVTAFRLGAEGGTISCRVLVNGEEVKQKTSETGTFGTASCTHFALSK